MLYLANCAKLKDVNITIIYKKEERQILTLKKWTVQI